MSDEKDQVEVELEMANPVEKDDQNDVIVEKEDEKVEKTRARETIDPEDGISDLKNKLQEEQQRRYEAENRAREAVQKQYRAQNESEEANFALVESAIKAVARDNEDLRAAYRDALSIGDHERAAEINETMMDNKIRLTELERGFNYMKAQKDRPASEAERPMADPVEAMASRLSPRSADWVRRNPQYVTDPRLYQKMVAAHQMVTADGIEPDTDDYFEAVEEALKVRRAPERRERVEQDDDATSEAAKPVQKRSAPPAAPVSRSSGGPGTPRSNVVKLTRAEVEAARDLGMTEQEYARNKMLLQKEGRI